MTIESKDYAPAGEGVVAEAEAVTAMEVTERSVVETSLAAVRNIINIGRDIGKIVINGDLGEAIRQSANHMS